MRARITGRLSSETKKVVGSGLWGTLQQGLVMASSIVITVVLIRVLPIDEYGVYAYAISMCGIGLTVMTAGLSAVAVKALVEDRANNSVQLGSILLIREAFAVLAYLIIGVVSLTSNSNIAVAATLIAGLSLFARAADAPEIWYTSTLRLGRAASIRSITTLVLLAVRIAAAIGGGSVWLFLGLYVLENLVASLLIFRRFLREPHGPGVARPQRRLANWLFVRSWPLMISGIANQVNLRADIVIIQAVMGSASVAVYSAASRISEIAYFLPVVFMNATFPVLLGVRTKKGHDSPEYKGMLQRSYDRAFWMGAGIAILIALSAPPLISPLLGSDYEGAASILVVQLIACPFVFMAAVFSKWIVAEDTLWVSVMRHSSGAALNVALNFLLLPILGIMGSAIATVSSYIVASYLSCFLLRGTRPAAYQMTLAMIAPIRLALHWISFRKEEEREVKA